MNNKKKGFKKLKKAAAYSFDSLQPNNSSKGGFTNPYLEFKDYTHLSFTIRSLLNVCILASQGDHHRPCFVKDPGGDIRQTLELVCQLLPMEEWEFLDKAYQVLVKG